MKRKIMIADDMKNRELYIKKYPILEKAFAFVQKSRAFTHTAEKKYKINENMYAVVGMSLPKKPDEQKLETHKKYADMQCVLKGKDIIGWKSLYNCKDIFKEYDAEKDIAFFNERAEFDIMLNEGSFALFFPQDAHSPLRGDTPVLKCIIKIKTELL
jgi:YhcH/YjgK/YiaL family protein